MFGFRSTAASNTTTSRVHAPSSLPFDCDPVPTVAQLEAHARAHAEGLLARGAADEFNGAAADEYYANWCVEAQAALRAEASKRYQVDSVLVAEAEARAHAARTRASVLRERVEQRRTALRMVDARHDAAPLVLHKPPVPVAPR